MLVEDLGRPGWASVAVSPSGAADLGSFRLANRLVGNQPEAAALETIGGFAVRFTKACYVAVTGAATVITLDGSPRPVNALLSCGTGQVLEAAFPTSGLRSYLTVRGGVAASPVLGSRSHDLLSGLGPPPAARGDLVETARMMSDFPDVEVAPIRPSEHGSFAVLPGPQTGWLVGSLGGSFSVLPDSNRIALRLSGEPIELRNETDVPPQGLVRGAVQVTAGGQLVVFGPDHPTTGGYPVVGVIAARHLDRLAQLRPGEAVVLRQAGS